MPLWQNTGEGWRPTPSLRNSLNNLDVYFCGCGPSLKNVKNSDIRGAGTFVAGVNNSYPHITPDIWFGMDDPSCYSRQVFWEPFVKVLRGGYQNRKCEGRDISKNYNLYYADALKLKDQEDMFRYLNDETKFIWKKNVMATSLHVLFWMGAKRIYLLGCDFSTGESDYHHGKDKLSEGNRKWNQSLYNQVVDWFKVLTPMAKKYGIEMISSTSGSRINEFMEYVSVEEAVKKSRKNIPWGGKLFHCREIDKEK